jgi:Gpi18-like mannosyltransferase
MRLARKIILYIQAWKEHLTSLRYFWVVEDVLLPFGVSRAGLLLVAWFARLFPPNPDYPLAWVLKQGWAYSPRFWLDVWARYDSGWYYSIFLRGYYLNGDLANAQSNVAFFPLYPAIIKGLSLLMGPPLNTRTRFLYLGILVSNALFVLALILLHDWVRSEWKDRELARRAVFFLLIFPTSFYFSCVYTEATNLFFLLLSVVLGSRGKWWLAGLAGAGAALSRPLGLLVVLVLGWQYMKSRDWKISQIRLDALGLALPAAALAVYLAYIGQVTGSWLAPFQVQSAWSNALVFPWDALFHPAQYQPLITPVNQFVDVVSLAALILAIGMFSQPVYGLYGLVCFLLPLSNGMINSSARYDALLFPVFAVMAKVFSKPLWERLATVVMITLQALLMVGWSQYYMIV